MSAITIHKTRFVDHLNDYFPGTVGQFNTGKSDQGTKTYQRAYCTGQLITNAFFSPLRIAGLIVRNSICSIGRIGKIAVLTCKLPWGSSENKAYWVKTALRLADSIIALGISPFQPIFVCSRLIAGIIKPSSYFRKEPFLLNDRLTRVLLENSFKINDIPSKNADNTKVLSNRAFISALYIYSNRWGLISSSENSSKFEKLYSSYFVTKKLLNKQRDDKVKEKYLLLKNFHEFLQEPEKFEKNKEVITFIKENFKTPRQKAALKMFLTKNPNEIITYSDISSLQGIKYTSQEKKLVADTEVALEVLLDKLKK